MSAFRPVPSASPPGADLPGDAPVRLLLTLADISYRLARFAEGELLTGAYGIGSIS